MNILLTGASGMIGQALSRHLSGAGHAVVPVSRSPSAPGAISWDPSRGELDLSRCEPIDAVIHLAGENIAAGRWTAGRKKRILDSRREGTQLVSKTIASLERRPQVMISASGVNYYAANAPDARDESSPSGADFLARVCREWEDAAKAASEAGIRVVFLRLGVVLNSSGGALGRMLPLFQRGLGGPLGSGRQRMSWIAIDDVVDIIDRCLSDERLSGPVNAVAPQVVTNREFTDALAAALHRRALFPAPAFALRLAFGALADEALLADIAVAPAKLLEMGYQFLYPELKRALEHVLACERR